MTVWDGLYKFTYSLLQDHYTLLQVGIQINKFRYRDIEAERIRRNLTFLLLLKIVWDTLNIVFNSVADPDPDPVGSGKKPESGSFIHKKTPVILIFLLYIKSKLQFRQK